MFVYNKSQSVARVQGDSEKNTPTRKWQYLRSGEFFYIKYSYLFSFFHKSA